jgi:hypothetical protein
VAFQRADRGKDAKRTPLYLWKPTLYRRGLWMKTSIAIRLLSEANYTRYMRGLGVVFIVAGLALIVAGALNPA